MNEIKKSFALGCSAEEIALTENVELTVVEQIIYDNADDIASVKEYVNRMGGM